MPPLPALHECHTAACLDAAAYITNFVDFTVDPCDNFYDYACGSSYENEPIPGWTKYIGTSHDMNDALLETIRQIMEGSYQDLLKSNRSPEFIQEESMKTDQELFSSLQAYYNSCMHTDALEQAGPTPIYPVLQRVKSAWPVGEPSGLTNALIELASLNQFPLAAFAVRPDTRRDPSRYILEISKPSLQYASYLDFTSPKSIHAFRLFLTKLITHVLSPTDPRHVAALESEGLQVFGPHQVETFVNRAINFQEALFNASGLIDSSKSEDLLMRLDDTLSDSTFIDWKRFLESVLPKGKHVPEMVNRYNGNYFDQLPSLVRDTDQEKIMDFFLSQVILSQVTHLDSTALDLDLKYTDFDSPPPRSIMCAAGLRRGVPNLIGRYYLMKNFGGARERQEVYNYVNLIHQTYKSRLERTEWLDSATRAKAIEKIDKFRKYVSYSISPPDERSPEGLKSFFANIVFGDVYFANRLTIARWKGLEDIWRYINDAVDKNSPETNFLEVNAYYDPTTNNIAIPAGFLQHQLYNADYPGYINFGSLGIIIGHELTHGYDNSGRRFDGDGRMTEWWSNQTKATFDEKAQCFVDQYSKFGFHHENQTYYVDGQLSLGENIADNGGIAVAYESFTNYLQSNSSAYVALPGIDLTPEQLFFVSAPRLFCEKQEVKTMIDNLHKQKHPPGKVRVTGLLQNFEPFAKAFKCPLGSNMNPEKKCALW